MATVNKVFDNAVENTREVERPRRGPFYAEPVRRPLRALCRFGHGFSPAGFFPVGGGTDRVVPDVYRPSPHSDAGALTLSRLL